MDALNGMPEYMQVCYKALLDIYDEIGMEMAEKGTLYRLFYAKEAVGYLYHNAYIVLSIDSAMTYTQALCFCLDPSDEETSERISRRSTVVKQEPYTHNGGVHASCTGNICLWNVVHHFVCGDGRDCDGRCF